MIRREMLQSLMTKRQIIYQTIRLHTVIWFSKNSENTSFCVVLVSAGFAI